MLHAIPERELRIRRAIRPIHRLQKKIPERQPAKIPRIGPRLRIHQLQLVSALLHQQSAGLGAHAYPVETVRSLNRPIRLDGNFKIARSAAPRSAAHPVAAEAPRRCTPQTASLPRIPKATALRSQPPALPHSQTSRRPARLHRQNPCRRICRWPPARSCSCPDHRLQPANRQKTAARPACAPSPCNV